MTLRPSYQNPTTFSPNTGSRGGCSLFHTPSWFSFLTLIAASASHLGRNPRPVAQGWHTPGLTSPRSSLLVHVQNSPTHPEAQPETLWRDLPAGNSWETSENFILLLLPPNSCQLFLGCLTSLEKMISSLGARTVSKSSLLELSKSLLLYLKKKKKNLIH